MQHFFGFNFIFSALPNFQEKPVKQINKKLWPYQLIWIPFMSVLIILYKYVARRNSWISAIAHFFCKSVNKR